MYHSKCWATCETEGCNSTSEMCADLDTLDDRLEATGWKFYRVTDPQWGARTVDVCPTCFANRADIRMLVEAASMSR